MYFTLSCFDFRSGAVREKDPSVLFLMVRGKNVNWSHMNWAGAKRSLLIACKYALVADCHFLSTLICECVCVRVHTFACE